MRMSVREQDVVMMEKEEGSGRATVVPMVKIEGNAGSSLPRFPRASERASGLLRDVNSSHHRAGLERAPNTHTTLQS